MAHLSGLKRAAASKSEHAEARFSGARVCARLHSGKEGQAIVEFALLLPILLMLIIGLFGFGLYIAYFQALTQAVGAGGQVLAHSRGVSSNPCADALTAIQAASPLKIDPANITVTVTFNGSSLGGSNNSCPGTASTNLGTAGGGTVVVGATYTYPCLFFNWHTSIICTPLSAQVTEYEY